MFTRFKCNFTFKTIFVVVLKFFFIIWIARFWITRKILSVIFWFFLYSWFFDKIYYTKTQYMNSNNIVSRYIVRIFFTLIFQIKFVNARKTLNLSIILIFIWFKWAWNFKRLLIIIFKYLQLFLISINLTKNCKFFSLFSIDVRFWKWINWYLFESNMKTCLVDHRKALSCNSSNFRLFFSKQILVIIMITSSIYFTIMIFKLSFVKIFNKSTL